MAAELRTVPAVTFICRPCLRHLSRVCLLICRNVNTDTAADTDDTLADGDDDGDKERGHGDTQHCHCLVTQYPTRTLTLTGSFCMTRAGLWSPAQQQTSQLSALSQHRDKSAEISCWCGEAVSSGSNWQDYLLSRDQLQFHDQD